MEAPALSPRDNAVIDAATGEVQPTILTGIPAVPAPNQAALSSSAQEMLSMAEMMSVTTVEEYGFAAEELGTIKARQKSLEEKRTSVAGPLHKAWVALNAMFKGPMDALLQAESLLKGKMIAFDQAREKARLAAEAEARAKAQAEQRRQEEIAAAERRKAAEETQRLADEAAKLRQAAAEAAAAGDTAAATLATAKADVAEEQAAEVVAGADIAETVRESTAAAMIAVAASAVDIPAAAKVKGIGKRTKWVVDITDKAALLAFVASRPELHALVDFDQMKLNKLADAQREGFAMPGAKARQEHGLSARAS